jgi:hypothetical protein
MPDRQDAPSVARVGKTLEWYVIFIAIAVAACLAVGYVTGVDALAATARFAWNVLAATANAALRATGQLLGLIAKGIGWRRLTRISNIFTNIGLSYSGSVVMSERRLLQAKGWTGRIKQLAAALRLRWLGLHIGWKLAIVVALIASQVYLHSVFIIFPIAFLVPVVRRLWVQTADLIFGAWYWRTFGSAHRIAVARLRRLPIIRTIIGATRVTRIRYLYAWRLWRYDARYRNVSSNKRAISLGEPIRLWHRGELDAYIGRPLLSGRRRANPSETTIPPSLRNTVLPIPAHDASAGS